MQGVLPEARSCFGPIWDSRAKQRPSNKPYWKGCDGLALEDHIDNLWNWGCDMPEIKRLSDLHATSDAISQRSAQTRFRVESLAEKYANKAIADQVALLSIVREKIEQAEGFYNWASKRIEDYGDEKLAAPREQARQAWVRWEDQRDALLLNINKALLDDLPSEKATYSFRNRHEVYRDWIIATYWRLAEEAKQSSKTVTKKKLLDDVCDSYWFLFGDELTAYFPDRDWDELSLSPDTVRRYIGEK